MMAIEQLCAMKRQAARDSLKNGTLPAVYNADNTPENCPIPFIGDRRPRGWKLVDRETLKVPAGLREDLVHDSICTAPYIEVDVSGWGGYGMVLERHQLLDLIETNPGYGWALVEVGQFQGVVAVFQPPKGNSDAARA